MVESSQDSQTPDVDDGQSRSPRPRTSAPALLLMAILLLPTSWLGMMLVHEVGHVITAWATGGVVQHVEFSPFAFSRTDVSPNPQPMLVTWAGPIAGIALPILAWLAAWGCVWRQAFLLRFFAGFCLLANGAYMAFGWILRVGDTDTLLRLGTPRWQMFTFGVAAMVAGLMLWNGQGCDFGLGPRAHPLRLSSYLWVAGMLVLMLGVSLAIG